MGLGTSARGAQSDRRSDEHRTRFSVVTGASSGIGEATAKHLDALGFTVFAGVRKEADAERIEATGSERLHALRLDVTDSSR